MYDIILASKSPRRRELLSQIGVCYRCEPSDKEEIITKTEPVEVVKELSRQKAEDIEQKLSAEKNTIIIGADTIVANAGEILGKPGNRENAAKMLKELSGHEHQVYTGVTVIYINEKSRQIITFAEKTEVFVKALSYTDIEKYIATDEPMDKAGAYGIQGKFAVYVEKINGDYNNVVGLPIARLYSEVKDNFDIDLVEISRNGD